MALGPLLSKMGLPEHKRCDTITANLIAEAAARCVQPGWAAQRGGYCPRQDGAERWEASSCYSEWHVTKNL